MSFKVQSGDDREDNIYVRGVAHCGPNVWSWSKHFRHGLVPGCPCQIYCELVSGSNWEQDVFKHVSNVSSHSSCDHKSMPVTLCAGRVPAEILTAQPNIPRNLPEALKAQTTTLSYSVSLHNLFSIQHEFCAIQLLFSVNRQRARQKAKIVDPKSFEEVPIIDLSLDEATCTISIDIDNLSIGGITTNSIAARMQHNLRKNSSYELSMHDL